MKMIIFFTATSKYFSDLNHGGMWFSTQNCAIVDPVAFGCGYQTQKKLLYQLHAEIKKFQTSCSSSVFSLGVTWSGNCKVIVAYCNCVTVHSTMSHSRELNISKKLVRYPCCGGSKWKEIIKNFCPTLTNHNLILRPQQ